MDIEIYRSLYAEAVASRDARLPKISFEDFAAGVTAGTNLLKSQIDAMHVELLMARIGSKGAEVLQFRIKHLEQLNASLLTALNQLNK